jgi:tetratricopeptide (TPR) repeat protein
MKHKFFVRSLRVGALVIAITALAVPAFAQTGSLRGRVVDAKGKPVADAELTLDYIGDYNKTITVNTDSKGEFIQAGMPIGKWNIKVKKGDLTARMNGVVVSLNTLYRIREDIVARSSSPTGGADTPSDLGGKGGGGKTAEDLQKMFKEAVADIQENRPDDAIAKLTELSTLSEKCATCFARMGDAYLKKADEANAEAFYKKAIDTDPEQPDAYAGLANLYNQQQKFDDAAKMGTKASELLAAAPGGGDASVVFNQGVIFWNQNKFTEAKLQFQRAVELDPKMAEAHFRLGMALVNEGKLQESKKEFEEYLKLAPTGENAATAKAILDTIK